MKVLKLESNKILAKVEKIFASIFPNEYRAIINGNQSFGVYFLFGENIDQKYPYLKYNSDEMLNYIIKNRDFFKQNMLLTKADIMIYEIEKCTNIMNITHDMSDEEIRQIFIK